LRFFDDVAATEALGLVARFLLFVGAVAVVPVVSLDKDEEGRENIIIIFSLSSTRSDLRANTFFVAAIAGTSSLFGPGIGSSPSSLE
jgi:hypothetical protein